MAGETLHGLIRAPDVEDASNSHRYWIRKNLIGPGVLILPRPDAVFVLRDPRHLLGLNAAVTTAAGASPGAVVLPDRCVLAVPSDLQCEAHHNTPRRVRPFLHLSSDGGKSPRIIRG